MAALSMRRSSGTSDSAAIKAKNSDKDVADKFC
jgi:hypothetical protein